MGRAGQAFVDDGTPPAQAALESPHTTDTTEAEAEAEAGQGR
jgi:hypothetical protein